MKDVTCSKVADFNLLLKVTPSMGVFHIFQLYKWFQIAQGITIYYAVHY